MIAALATHNILGLSSFGVSALVALTIATSVDYLIFLIGRYQEARVAGEDPEAAYLHHVSRDKPRGPGVGLTIAGAMFCLTFTRLPYLSNPGLPSVIGLLIVILASLSLAPAIITVASRFGLLESRRPQRTRVLATDRHRCRSMACPGIGRSDPGNGDRAALLAKISR